MRAAGSAAAPVRVKLEQGKKNRVVACNLDWHGWDRCVWGARYLML